MFARSGNWAERLALLMEMMGATGPRVIVATRAGLINPRQSAARSILPSSNSGAEQA